MLISNRTNYIIILYFLGFSTCNISWFSLKTNQQVSLPQGKEQVRSKSNTCNVLSIKTRIYIGNTLTPLNTIFHTYKSIDLCSGYITCLAAGFFSSQTQSAEAVENTDCFSTGGKTPSDECLGYGTNQSNIRAPSCGKCGLTLHNISSQFHSVSEW